MPAVTFQALEYTREASFHEARYRYEGDEREGWRVLRQGREHLRLPPGYRLLRSTRCGICSTDLARHHLPFPLPQVTGHEVLAEGDSGRTFAVEINASHASTGSPLAETCPLCRQGLARHCPDRLVLGIDRLPGGFAPWILVPVHNAVEIPGGLDPDAAVLLEPFAAALHATERAGLADANRVGVLGAGRLGLLVVAALRARREVLGASFSIEAIDHHPDRLRLASRLGAERTWSETLSPGDQPFDIVFECTGNPAGLEAALKLARREVHLKSTTGVATLGLEHATEMVVDEISLGRLEPDRVRTEALPSGCEPTALLLGPALRDTASRLLEGAGYRIIRAGGLDEVPGTPGEAVSSQVDLAVVDSLALIDKVLRPWPGVERGIVRPLGRILVADVGQPRTGLLEAVLDRGVRIGTSRCGDFRHALPFLQGLLEQGLPLAALVTNKLPASRLPQAFEFARRPASIKVVVLHGGPEPVPGSLP